MKQIYFLLILIFLAGFIHSCSSTKSLDSEPANDQQTVATIQNSAVTYDELKMGYSGSLENGAADGAELRNFLPSYVDYRLKILEGRQLGYFEDPDVLSEYRTFAKEAAEKLWMNREISSRILETFIERSQKELLAYHILITAQNPGFEESRAIKERLKAARLEILEGADPDSVNIKYSSMQNENYAGGPLPWITAGRTVKSFEDVLFSLEPGEVSEPFQTEFGFHIIYLIDERPRTPEKLTSHIFVSKQGNENPYQKISEALDSLRHDADWSEVVNEFSDDRRTASGGGEIGWVGYGMQFPELFVDEVMNRSGQEAFSDIIEMDYGYHIIKIDSVRNFTNRKTIEQYAESELERLGRLQPGKDELFEMLKEYGRFRVFEEEFEKVADYLLGNAVNYNDNRSIAEFNDKPVLSNQFVEFYEQEFGGSSNETGTIDDTFEQFMNRIIESNLIELTKERFDAYRFEMEQFLNGLVVFKVNEEFLWNPDAADEQLLRDHFKENREKYMKEKTISYQRVTATSDTLIAYVRANLLENRNPEKLEKDYENIIVRPGKVSNINSGLYEKLNDLGKHEATEIENNDTWFQFYYITDVEPERRKTFEEAKEEVFNEVREQHESDYLQSLREKYETKLHPENVQ